MIKEFQSLKHQITKSLLETYELKEQAADAQLKDIENVVEKLQLEVEDLTNLANNNEVDKAVIKVKTEIIEMLSKILAKYNYRKEG